MFYRNMTDTTGLEPMSLFNIVQFMTFDHDMTGEINEDDTMASLFARSRSTTHPSSDPTQARPKQF